MKIKNLLFLLPLSLAFGANAQNITVDNVKDIEAYYPIPTEAQMKWQEMEYYAFIHLGLNTFNDLEWGYGNTPAKTFNPKNLNADKWVKTMKMAGMTGIILTAKHHDGFCLWPTKTTNYSVKNSPWRNGKGDLVKELSDACHKYGMKFGLYLSPWDRNNKHYGYKEYQKIFHEQIRELTTNYGELFEYWFDGANGGNGWYGGADTTRNIEPKTYYKYDEAVENILKKNNPDIMIFGGTSPTIRWVGNEHGEAGMTNYSAFNKDADERRGFNGDPDGKDWLPAEVDVSIRPGWFYHKREDHQVKSLGHLVNIYYNSVGRNATLLLNCPIDRNGELPKLDSLRLMQLKNYLDKTFANDLFANAKISASSTKSTNYSTDNLLKNDYSFWASDDSKDDAYIDISLDTAKEINLIELKEHIRLGQRVDKFDIYYRNVEEDTWRKVYTKEELTTIGYRRLIRINPIKTDKMRIYLHACKAPICMNRIAAYKSDEILEEPKVYRDANGKINIKASNDFLNIIYSISNGSKDLNYKEPFLQNEDNIDLSIKIQNPENGDELKYNHKFGYTPNVIKIENTNDELNAKLLDTDGYTAHYFGKGIDKIKIKFDKKIDLSKIIYKPNQQRDADGHIIDYAIYSDNKLIIKSKFDNIKNNPIAQDIILPKKIKTDNIEIRVFRTTHKDNIISIGSLEFFK